MFLVFTTNLCFAAVLVYQKYNLRIAIFTDDAGEVPDKCRVICLGRMLQDRYWLERIRGLRKEQSCCISLGQHYPFRGSTGAPRPFSVLPISLNNEEMGWGSPTDGATDLGERVDLVGGLPRRLGQYLLRFHTVCCVAVIIDASTKVSKTRSLDRST